MNFQLLFVLQSGAMTDPGHGTKIYEREEGLILYFARRDPGDLTSISLFLSS